MTNAHRKVLLIEDNATDAQIIREAFADMKDHAYELEWARSLSNGLESLAKGDFALVLTDLHLPESQGIETLAKVTVQARKTPVVVLTVSDDEALAMEVLHHGAQDYLIKGHVQVYPDLLGRSVRYAIERKRVEEKEKELSEVVAGVERRRAAELDRAYQKLKRTQAMLVQAEKMSAVGLLASGIAHEVKNPLNIIMQCVSFLEPTLKESQPQEQDTLQVIQEAVRRADSMIHRMLDFAKPSPLELKPVPIARVLMNALALVQPTATGKQIQVVKEIPAGLPTAMLDENQISQVFINLFLNALQAMPEGARLTVRASAKELVELGSGVGSRVSDVFDLGETVLCVEVEDTGSGIPKDVLSKVLNPFFTTKPPGEGVGLGLSITNSIIAAHRGMMHIESEEGRGTKVTVQLPLTITSTSASSQADGSS